MLFSYFKGDTAKLFTCLSIPDSRVKFKQFDKFLNRNLNDILEKNIIMRLGYKVQIPFRGLILLPKKESDLFDGKRVNFFDNTYLHMCCLTKLNDQPTFYTHLLDSDGILINGKIMDSKDLIVLLISSYIISKSQVGKI